MIVNPLRNDNEPGTGPSTQPPPGPPSRAASQGQGRLGKPTLAQSGLAKLDEAFLTDEFRRYECEVEGALATCGGQLSPPERRFLAAYVWDGDAVSAYMWAFHVTDRGVASRRGYALTRSVRIRRALRAYYNVVGLTDADIVGEITALAFGTAADALGDDWEVKPLSELEDGALRSIAGVEKNSRGGVKVRFHDKLRALELLARVKGLLVDKSEVTLHGGIEARLLAARERLAVGDGGSE